MRVHRSRPCLQDNSENRPCDMVGTTVCKMKLYILYFQHIATHTRFHIWVARFRIQRAGEKVLVVRVRRFRR